MIKLLQKLALVVKAFSDSARAAALEARRARATARQASASSNEGRAPVEEVGREEQGPSTLPGENVNELADRIEMFARNRRVGTTTNPSEKILGSASAEKLGVVRELKAPTAATPGRYLQREGFVLDVNRRDGSISGVSRKGKSVPVYSKMTESAISGLTESKLVSDLLTHRKELFD